MPHQLEENKPAAGYRQVAEQSDKSARELVDYLLESGSPPGTLALFDSWRDQNPGATAADLYNQMATKENHVVNIGTLRKAGKWIWGPAFEPQTDEDGKISGEMVEQVQRENATLREQLRVVTTDKLGLVRQVEHLRARNEELSREVARYRARGVTA